MFRTIERPRLLSGRLARPTRADEAVVDDLTAAERHLRVGSHIRLWAFTAAQQGDPATTVFSKYPAPEGPSYSFRVVGVVRVPSGVDAPPASVTRDTAYGSEGAMYLTPAFLRATADEGVPVEALPGMEIFQVRLRRGLADLPAFERAVARRQPGDGQIHVGSHAENATSKTAGAIHLESLGLILFGVLAGLAALLILGQALSRQVAADSADHPTLAALGMSRREPHDGPARARRRCRGRRGRARGGDRGRAVAAHTDWVGAPGRDRPGRVDRRRGARARIRRRRRAHRRVGACAVVARRAAQCARTLRSAGAGPAAYALPSPASASVPRPLRGSAWRSGHGGARVRCRAARGSSSR